MRTIQIGSSDTRNLYPVDATWVRDRVQELRSHNIAICVKIRIQMTNMIAMRLA